MDGQGMGGRGAYIEVCDECTQWFSIGSHDKLGNNIRVWTVKNNWIVCDNSDF